MKNSFCRNSCGCTAARLLLLAFGMIVLAGCHSNQVSDKPGADMNSGMSEQQKALIAQHKKQAEQ